MSLITELEVKMIAEIKVLGSRRAMQTNEKTGKKEDAVDRDGNPLFELEVSIKRQSVSKITEVIFEEQALIYPKSLINLTPGNYTVVLKEYPIGGKTYYRIVSQIDFGQKTKEEPKKK